MSRPQFAMTREQRTDCYARRRVALMVKLGGECAGCGYDNYLEFDHIDPATKTWRHNRINRLQRIARLEREAAVGLIQLLCVACNRRKAGLSPQFAPRWMLAS